MNPFITHALRVLQHYEQQMPLHLYLKADFRKHPVLGSRDRKIISALVFAWMRAANYSKAVDSHLRLKEAAMWSEIEDKFFKKVFDSEKLEDSNALVFNNPDSYPELSAGISWNDWRNSILKQPDVFIRVRKGFAKNVEEALAGMVSTLWLTDEIVQLPHGVSLDTILKPEWFVVQDLHSQKLMNHFPVAAKKVWDCCSGAGGKSLWLADHVKLQHHYATDIRPGIINNLKNRFRKYKLPTPQTAIVDLEEENSISKLNWTKNFDALLIDVPCSGSGTWARTPEEDYFFEKENLNKHTRRQRNILKNLLQISPSGNYLFYATCSVFKEENEDQVDYLLNNGCALIESQLLDGTGLKADSMYYALLQKN